MVMILNRCSIFARGISLLMRVEKELLIVMVWGHASYDQALKPIGSREPKSRATGPAIGENDAWEDRTEFFDLLLKIKAY